MSASYYHPGLQRVTRKSRAVAGQNISEGRYARQVAMFFVFLLFVVMSLLLGLVTKKPETVLALAAGLILALAIIRWPVVGTYSSASIAILFDFLPSAFVHTLLSDMGIFRNLSYKGLPEFVYVSLFEIVVVLTMASALVRRFHNHQKVDKGALYWPMLAFGAMVLFGMVYGILSGGDFKIRSGKYARSSTW